MRVEAVVISVDCGDYLAHTLPLNKSLFSRLVVVTASHDAETRRVCQHFNVECFLTEAFYDGGDEFNKGKGVNVGLEHLERTGGFKDWVAHLDADIVLPPLTRHILERLSLNEQFLYGVDRLMCPSYEYWQRFVRSPLPQHDQAYVHVGPYPVGTRLMKLEQGGWVPLGFFQLFHRQANALRERPYYPTEWDTAATSDLYFAYKWPRTHRQLLPEILAIHLATEDITHAAMGQNWKGRRTSRFEPRDPFFVGEGYRPVPRPDTNNQ